MTLRPTRAIQLANLVVFQSAWFAAVLGAAHGFPLLGTVAVMAAVGWHLGVSARPVEEAKLVGVVCIFGFVVESVIAMRGVVAFPSGQPDPRLAPYWMVALWGLLAIALNVTMRWLRPRLWLAAVLGAVAGPASFASGVALGGARFVDAPAAMVQLAIVWTVALPLLVWLSMRFDGVAVPEAALMLEQSPLFGAALAGLALTVALACLTWVASVVRRDVSLVDRTWSLYIAGAGLVYFALLPAQGARGLCMVVLAVAWALRLSIFITWRNWGHGEDRRYQEIRARNEPNFALKSLYLVFLLQAVLAWIVSAPFLAGMAAGGPMGWLDAAGFALAAFGIVFEAVGDLQMARFRGDPANRGKVMDQGLWRFTRHPNYFGEACVWWGLWLMAMGAAGWAGAWSAISPVLMTVLLLKVSGVRLLEKDIGERRPGYREYVLRTNAFIPGPPRRVSP